MFFYEGMLDGFFSNGSGGRMKIDVSTAPPSIIAVVADSNDEADRACKDRTGRGYVVEVEVQLWLST